MRWIASFTDTPDMMEIRKERQDLHLEYLKTNESEILIAGGCRAAPDGAYVGGLWILEGSTKERAIALIENDLYFVPSCRTYQLLIWDKAFAEKFVVL
jgi:uncharacterized protein YciI